MAYSVIHTPYVTVDGIIQLYGEDEVLQGIVLIERKNPPHGWAIPGGFVDIGETVEQAVVREMKEETSLDVTIERLLGVYSDPARDPRFHTVSVVFVCKAYGVPKAEDDAKSLAVIPLNGLKDLDLVFDHAKIIDDFMKRKICLV